MNNVAVVINSVTMKHQKRIPMNECEHKYIHFDTKKNVVSAGPYQREWTRVDQFFCEHCCDTKIVRKEEYNRDMPEWY